MHGWSFFLFLQSICFLGTEFEFLALRPFSFSKLSIMMLMKRMMKKMIMMKKKMMMKKKVMMKMMMKT